MAWAILPTNYKDIVWSGLKRYTQIDNDDGTISFRDDTHYTYKEQSFFGAKEANQINEAINYIMTKLENGTNLYTEFQTFFNNQRQLFINAKDEVITDITHKTDSDYDLFKGHLDDLKQQGNSSLTEIESNYQQRMSIYENQQKALFDLWFSDIKAQLSGDVAGNLQKQIETLGTKIDGFLPNDITFSTDGKTITEKVNDKKIVTEFISDTTIVQKLYVNEVLNLTKTITFLNGGKNIKEVVE
ncbi:hypothetical protein [Criibacterium bergeronii]|uniref:Uncharacterized protein n=1 Tax=Criibacterium bergeronii TaxID=1871336 RepID=A0A1C0ADY6_9FIRM|nr:hypothetical protein [Criibacterium bergeronii]RDY21448.1 hypothetical protein BBG48_004830 [Criibacterium bergeronii]